MNIRILTALSLVFVFAFPLAAQDKDEKKKDKKKQPQLTVVEIQEERPIAPPVEQQKPANGSLFTDNAANASLLSDFKARRVGDLVFIDVVEDNAAKVTSGAKRDRDSGTVGGIGTAAGALPVPGAVIAGTIVGALGTRKYEGNGSTQRNSTVRGRITARVVEVLPNGDLKIEALKLVKINRETEQLAVSGVVRPSDLSGDNSIETIYVGDLRVEFNGKGVASKDNAPGWLFRLFDKVTPF